MGTRHIGASHQAGTAVRTTGWRETDKGVEHGAAGWRRAAGSWWEGDKAVQFGAAGWQRRGLLGCYRLGSLEVAWPLGGGALAPQHKAGDRGGCSGRGGRGEGGCASRPAGDARQLCGPHWSNPPPRRSTSAPRTTTPPTAAPTTTPMLTPLPDSLTTTVLPPVPPEGGGLEGGLPPVPLSGGGLEGGLPPVPLSGGGLEGVSTMAVSTVAALLRVTGKYSAHSAGGCTRSEEARGGVGGGRVGAGRQHAARRGTGARGQHRAARRALGGALRRRGLHRLTSTPVFLSSSRPAQRGPPSLVAGSFGSHGPAQQPQ